MQPFGESILGKQSPERRLQIITLHIKKPNGLAVVDLLDKLGLKPKDRSGINDNHIKTLVNYGVLEYHLTIPEHCKQKKERPRDGHRLKNDLAVLPLLIDAFDHRQEAQHVLMNSQIYRGWIPELIERFDDSIPLIGVITTAAWYLFSWNDVPGKDNERLIRFIRNELGIGMAESVKICKSDDDRTIRISNDRNSAEILIDEKKGKATLKISDGRIQDLKVKRENGRLNIYTTSSRVKHPLYDEVVGRVEAGDDVSMVMEEYHLPKEYEEYVKECLKLLESKEYIEKRLDVLNIVSSAREIDSDLKQEDVSFLLIQPHLSESEKECLEKSLKTNWLALKFVSCFTSVNYKERHKIITQMESDTTNPFKSPSAARMMERFTTLKWVASCTDIPSADYDRMFGELFDAFERKPRINWIEFFDQLSYFNSKYQFLFA